MSAWKQYVSADGAVYYFNEETGESSFDIPDELTHGDEKDTGKYVWIPNEDAANSNDAFFVGKVLSDLHGGAKEVQLDSGQRLTVKKGVTLEPLKKASLSVNYPDLVFLDQLNKPLILHNLKQRFLKNEIYTNVGTILISINPYQQLPLYTANVMQQYRNRGTRDLPPHVFIVSDDAYQRMIDQKMNQSIIISGESGAGKTGQYLFILFYLCFDFGP
jgi:myosin heavy subunit